MFTMKALLKICFVNKIGLVMIHDYLFMVGDISGTCNSQCKNNLSDCE